MRFRARVCKGLIVGAVIVICCGICMKIWCCLCFGEEEDDKKGTMRGGNFQDEGEAKVGDMEIDEPERFLLELLTGSPDESESQMVDASRDLGEREEVGGSNALSRDFDQFASSSGQGLMEEVDLSLSLGEEPSSTLDRELDRNSRNKRPKLHFFSL